MSKKVDLGTPGEIEVTKALFRGQTAEEVQRDLHVSAGLVGKVVGQIRLTVAEVPEMSQFVDASILVTQRRGRASAPKTEPVSFFRAQLAQVKEE